MKKIGVKKLAALAAGAALVGSALAPFATAQAAAVVKSDVYDADGSVKVNVVAGRNAAYSDWEAAGNIVGALARNATVTGSATCAATGAVTGASCDVSGLEAVLSVGGTLTVSGGKRYQKDLNSNLDIYEIDNVSLTDAQLPHLYNESTSYKHNGSSSNLTIKETMGLTADAFFSTDSDTEDLILEIGQTDWNYMVDLGSGLPACEGAVTGASCTAFNDDQNDNMRVPWFGEMYIVDQIDLDQADGFDYVKLVKSTQKLVYGQGQTFTVEGKEGTTYEGQTLTVTVSNILQTAPTASSYQAVLTIADAEGTVLDQRTATTGSLTFEDSNAVEINGDAIYIESIGLDPTTNTSRIEVLQGSEVIELKHGDVYPYDPSFTGTDKDWKTHIVGDTSDSNKLEAIGIVNDYVRWKENDYEGGSPIYASEGALTVEAEPTEVNFYNDFATVQFLGFQQDESLTQLEIGSVDGIHGLKFRDGSDVTHEDPFMMTLSGPSGEFEFDGRVLSYKVNHSDINIDVNQLDATTKYLNGSIFTDINCDSGGGTGGDGNVQWGGTTSLTSCTVGDQIKGPNGETLEIAGFPADNVLTLTADGNFGMQLGSWSNTSPTWLTVPFNTLRNNSFYFTENDLNQEKVVTLQGNNYNLNYIPYINANEEIHLLMDAQSQNLQYGAGVNFLGTTVPTSGTEDYTIDYTFYVPDEINVLGTTVYDDKNAGTTVAVSETDNSFFTAIFEFDEGEASTNVYDGNVYINTIDGELHSLPNNNMDLPTVDVNYGDAGTTWNAIKLSLREDTPDTYYSMAYTDFGSKLWVEDDKFYALFPENMPQVEIWVKGEGTTTTTEGGETFTVAEGDAGTTTTGTTVTVDSINYTTSVTGGDGNVVCEATPATYDMMAPPSGRGRLYSDMDAPATNNIVVGGWAVNVLADAALLRDQLTQAGDKVVLKGANGDIYVAGYTSADTSSAAGDLVTQIEQFA